MTHDLACLSTVKLRIHAQYSFRDAGQCNGDKIVALPSRGENYSSIMPPIAAQSFLQSLPKVQNIELSATIAARHDRRANFSSRR